MKRASLLFISFCILVATFEAMAISLSPTHITGRWRGHHFSPGKCADKGCNLAFDIVPCGQGWCGIALGKNDACGAATLTLNAGTAKNEAELRFEGKLTLAEGSEPYGVRVDLDPSDPPGDLLLNFVGASEAHFALLDRDFPFSALLVRAGDAVCKADKSVS